MKWKDYPIFSSSSLTARLLCTFSLKSKKSLQMLFKQNKHLKRFFSLFVLFRQA